jgi:hypothetical protein
VANSIGRNSAGLDSWGNSTFENFKNKLANLCKELERVRRTSMGRGPSTQENKLMERINEVLLHEEIWIKQRSRMNWLKLEDRNSAYFHAYASQRKKMNAITSYFPAYASQRKKMNAITSLQREDGSLCEDTGNIKSEIQSFFF